MTAPPAISVLIPAYNEAPVIVETVQRVRQVMEEQGGEFEIIVVDDGSDDGTGELAEAEGVPVVRHPANGGYGLAVKTGMRHAKHPWCAIVDADGSYPLDELPRLLGFLPRFDMVVGARQGEHYWGSRRKTWARSALLHLVNFTVGTRVPDVNSGMRVFRKDIALAHASRISSGFSFTTTLTLAMLLEHHFVHYEPIQYFARVGASKVRMGRDSLRMLQIVVQAIVYYNPLKVFLPVCGAAFAIGAVMGGLVASADPVAGVSVFTMGLLATLTIAALGLVAEAMRLARAG